VDSIFNENFTGRQNPNGIKYRKARVFIRNHATWYQHVLGHKFKKLVVLKTISLETFSAWNNIFYCKQSTIMVSFIAVIFTIAQVKSVL